MQQYGSGNRDGSQTTMYSSLKRVTGNNTQNTLLHLMHHLIFQSTIVGVAIVVRDMRLEISQGRQIKVQ